MYLRVLNVDSVLTILSSTIHSFFFKLRGGEFFPSFSISFSHIIMLRRTIPLAAITASARSMSVVVGSSTRVTERTHSCTDGVKLATRHWANFDVNDDDDDDSPSSRRRRRRRTRKILCLHGWLDNAASFERLAPALLESLSSSYDAIPTEIVALDFPGEFVLLLGLIVNSLEGKCARTPTRRY